MKALVTHEIIGQTLFGDPEILVTVLEPHPKAGFQLLLRSTASMDHMSKKLAETGKTTYLAYGYPDPDSPRHHGWHGAVEEATLEGALADIAGYVDWLWRREQVRDAADTMELTEALDRFNRGLWENSAIDYEQEWARVKTEVARIELALKGWRDDEVREEHLGASGSPG
jgi:hypothetical protein